ncbi:MAG: helix-turn-helix domain-containing protein [Selenomonadales bacterium]|nr:helix-turn-helix domain-containing protein [Selenomonadales bacterium]
MTKLTDGLLTLAEFAKAVNATYNQVYLWVTKHGLPCVQVGSRRYIREEDYEAWLESRKTVTVAPKKKKEVLREVMEEISTLPRPRKGGIAAKMERIY